MNTYLKNRGFFLILVLGSLTALGPLSIDLYLPAFPEIARGLKTDIADISYSLSSFFIGLSIGQLVYGPMLERFGRKKPMYFGLSLYMLASIGCALAGSVQALIVFRFFQAFGSCAGLVSSRAIVRDLFKGKQVARIFSTLMMVVAVSPIFAPSAGGILSAYFGWRSVFLVLTLLAAGILMGAIFILPNTRNPNPAYSLKIPDILRNFATIIKHPVFFVNAFTGAIAYSGLYAYISGSPHLYMELLKLNEQQYGWVFAIIAAGLITATQLNNQWLKKLQSEQIILVSLAAQAVMGILLLVTTLWGGAGVVGYTLLIFGFLFFMGFIFPNASALTLAPMGHVAGSASALMGGIQMCVGASASALVGFLQGETPVPMASVMAVCALGSLALFYFGRRLWHLHR